MINCPKCGADNQIGAIFCRGCGEKLELDELQPETVQEAARSAEGKPRTNWFGIIKNVVMLVLLALTILVLVSLFLKPPGGLPMYEEPAAKKTKQIQSDLDRFQRQKRRTFSLDEDELNYLVRHLMVITEEEIEKQRKKNIEDGTNALMLTEFYIYVIDPERDRVRFILKEEHTTQSWIRFYNMVEADVTADSTGLHVDMDSAKLYMGRFPMHLFGFTSERVLGHFRLALEGKQELNQLIKTFKGVKIEQDRVRFSRRPSRKRSKDSDE